MSEIHVSVWKHKGDSEQIMGFSCPSYPNYRKDDIIFLEKDIGFNTPANVKENNPPMRLTKFIIKDVMHSVRQWFCDNSNPNAENPFPFTIRDYMSVEIYVEKFTEDED